METFKKEERLCNKKTIESLFKKGKASFAYPFNVKWTNNQSDNKFPAQILIIVPKRNFKKAVDRNRLKRIIREAYRKNKSILYQTLVFKNVNIAFALIYTEKEILKYKLIEDKIIITLQRLIKDIEKSF